MERAITPLEKDSVFDGPLLDELIRFINEAITIKNWHNNYADQDNYRESYFAIILSPVDRFSNKVLDKAVDVFKKVGWDCLHKGCYDARGPHHCFYVNKKHFTE